MHLTVSKYVSLDCLKVHIGSFMYCSSDYAETKEHTLPNILLIAVDRLLVKYWLLALFGVTKSFRATRAQTISDY